MCEQPGANKSCVNTSITWYTSDKMNFGVSEDMVIPEF